MFDLFNRILYIQISPERLTVRNPKNGETISEVAEVAISIGPKARIIAVGSQARAALGDSSVKIVRPFAHPRSLVSDFTTGVQLLKAFIRRLQGDGLSAPAPEVVMHPQGDPDGGFTQIEIRAIHEMALAVGARRVTVWQGRTLTDSELMARQFPSDGMILS